MAQELDTVLNLYKRKSETPLQTIERYVALHPEFSKTKMTYAGRLDPMAEGLLVVLSGEKNKEREIYTGLDKDYEFEFVLGVSTDTFDILGKITEKKSLPQNGVDEKIMAAALKKYMGEFEQKYPPYSSKVLNGTPLFELARRGVLQERDIPTHLVTASRLDSVSSRQISASEFSTFISSSIDAVRGDFRQKEILDMWKAYFADKATPQTFTVYKARVSCGSGFYVRQLVSDLGRDLGVGAVTVSIVRTRVGTFMIKDSI